MLLHVPVCVFDITFFVHEIFLLFNVMSSQFLNHFSSAFLAQLLLGVFYLSVPIRILHVVLRRVFFNLIDNCLCYEFASPRIQGNSVFLLLVLLLSTLIPQVSIPADVGRLEI